MTCGLHNSQVIRFFKRLTDLTICKWMGWRVWLVFKGQNYILTFIMEVQEEAVLQIRNV